MKCQFCDNDATVTYEVVVDGKSKKSNLCEQCAEDKGISSFEEFGIPDFLMEQVADDIESKLDKPLDMTMSSEPEMPRQLYSECDECGFTLSDFKKIGRLGCSFCYETFAEEVEEMIKNMHKGTEHMGKEPEGQERMLLLYKLEEMLQKAIAEENFEDAARLRDQLKDYKQSISVEG